MLKLPTAQVGWRNISNPSQREDFADQMGHPVPVVAIGVRLRVDEPVGGAPVVECVGEAAGEDLVEDGAGAAAAEAEEVRPRDLHAGVDPGRGELVGAYILQVEPHRSLVEHYGLNIT